MALLDVRQVIEPILNSNHFANPCTGVVTRWTLFSFLFPFFLRIYTYKDQSLLISSTQALQWTKLSPVLFFTYTFTVHLGLPCSHKVNTASSYLGLFQTCALPLLFLVTSRLPHCLLHFQLTLDCSAPQHEAGLLHQGCASIFSIAPLKCFRGFSIQYIQQRSCTLDRQTCQSSILSRPLPDETSKLADDPEAMKREMRMIQRESLKVGRSEGQKVRRYWER